MANTNGRKYGFTALFPIRGDADCGKLRSYLRDLHLQNGAPHPGGSPFADAANVHQARFVIVERLAFQGVPAQHDQLKSKYLLLLCDFDGANLDDLIDQLEGEALAAAKKIWSYCVSLAGLDAAADADAKAALRICFAQCQVKTNLFFVDQPDATVADILRALRSKRDFADFVVAHQGAEPADLMTAFYAMWRAMTAAPLPRPGSM
jgi:hypothetical protein